MKTFRLIGMAIMAILISVSFTACSDDEEKPETPSKPPIEEFTQGNMNFTEKASEQTFTFIANAAWSVNIASTSGGSSWCTASPSSGNAGSQTIKITTTENDTYDDRSVTVTLKSGNESNSFVVTQKQKNAILLTSNKFEFEQKGGTFTVEVKANVNYTATIGENCKDWITEGGNTRALSTTTKTYSVAANENSEKREGTITFTDGTLSETVHIYQTGGDIILLSKNEYYTDAAGEDITVELKSNCEYEVEMPKVDWVHEISTRALSSHTLHYRIDANTTYDSREAKINYRNKKKNVVETLTIIQAQKDAIILGKKTITAKAEGETIEVKLSTNVDYEVIMPAGTDWITTANTRGLTEHTLHYIIEKNESNSSRSAKITFSNKNSGIEDILTVTQNGQMPTIITLNVPTAGELPKITERRDFTALKLTGYLNGADITAIRQMENLEYLDISEAKIVKGRAYYYNYQTQDDVIGEYMFSGLNIKNILLPNSVTKIGERAFLQCTSLTSIDIPNSVTEIEEGTFWLCESLTSIDIPNSVTKIGRNAFMGCTSLTSIDIPNSVTEIGEVAFKDCTSLTSIEIHNSVTEIGEWAFYRCESLTSIDIPNSVTEIGERAFLQCMSLTSIEIPNSVTKIGEWAFYRCESLTSIDIPNSVTEIGEGAFEDCTSLTSIKISNSFNSVTKIGKGAFSGCRSLTSIDIPNSVTEIGEVAFKDCTNVVKVKIGAGITSIKSSYLLGSRYIKEIYCFATTPPNSLRRDFSDTYKNEAKLYIPKGSYQAYFLSNWGEAFNNIIEMEE